MMKTYTYILVSSLTTLLLSSYGQAESLQIVHYSSAKNLSNASLCYQMAKNLDMGQAENFKALKYCNRAIRSDKLDKFSLARSYINRGVILKNLHNTRYAKGDFLRAHRLLGDLPELRINQGNLAYMTGSFDKAIGQYTKAIDMKLTTPYIAYLNRGLANERIGDVNAAQQDYQSALEDNPKLDTARKQLIDITRQTLSFYQSNKNY